MPPQTHLTWNKINGSSTFIFFHFRCVDVHTITRWVGATWLAATASWILMHAKTRKKHSFYFSIFHVYIISAGPTKYNKITLKVAFTFIWFQAGRVDGSRAQRYRPDNGLEVINVLVEMFVIKLVHNRQLSILTQKQTSINSWQLDALQSPTLAHPAAPLASGLTKTSSVHKNQQKWLPRQRPSGNRLTQVLLKLEH